MARENWYTKGSTFTGNCGISGRTTDEQYVDAKVELYSGMPLFIGNSQIEEWARDLGMVYPTSDLHVENEILLRQNALVMQALERFEQIFNVLGSVGVNLSDDLTLYVDSIRPDLEAIRQNQQADDDSDRDSAETDRQAVKQNSESGPIHPSGDGTEHDAEGINLGIR